MEYPLPPSAQGEVKGVGVTVCKSIWVLYCLRGSFLIPATWEKGKIGGRFGSWSKRVWRSAPMGSLPRSVTLVVL